jgi:hypothetical protein
LHIAVGTNAKPEKKVKKKSQRPCFSMNILIACGLTATRLLVSVHPDERIDGGGNAIEFSEFWIFRTPWI